MLARGLATAAFVVFFDQLSKIEILHYFSGFPVRDPLVEVTPYFDLVRTYNHGMSFGLFDNGSGINAALFSAVAAAIVVILIAWLRRAAHPLLAVAIGLIIGGAVGNVIDRLRLGGVVDFLYFHIGAYAWPAFNLADTAICVGVAAMLLDGLLLHRRAH